MTRDSSSLAPTIAAAAAVLISPVCARATALLYSSVHLLRIWQDYAICEEYGFIEEIFEKYGATKHAATIADLFAEVMCAKRNSVHLG